MGLPQFFFSGAEQPRGTDSILGLVFRTSREVSARLSISLEFKNYYPSKVFTCIRIARINTGAIELTYYSQYNDENA